VKKLKDKKKSRLLLQVATRFFLIASSLLSALIPFSFQLKFFGNLGLLSYYLSRRYRHICKVNLSRCFPEKSTNDIKKLSKEVFYYMGRGIAEALATWKFSDKRFNNIKCEIHGLEDLQCLQRQEKGVMLFLGHFYPMELMARKVFGKISTKLLYRKYSNSVFDQYVLSRRSRQFECIEKRKIKRAVVDLKNGATLCYLPDQNILENHCFEDFFNIPCSMPLAIERLPKMTGARAAFFHYYYDKLTSTYHVHFKVLDEVMTPAIYNRLLEKVVREHPEQYFWTHRRFKTRPEGDTTDFYQ
jgi:Kdo2-lipid IVA lauroyltransferase/acyltransferase